ALWCITMCHYNSKHSASREKLELSADTMALEPYIGKDTDNPPYAAGIRGRDVVTAINGESPNVAGRGFLIWFIKNFEPGDRVTATVVNSAGERRDVSYDLSFRG